MIDFQSVNGWYKNSFGGFSRGLSLPGRPAHTLTYPWPAKIPCQLRSPKDIINPKIIIFWEKNGDDGDDGNDGNDGADQTDKVQPETSDAVSTHKEPKKGYGPKDPKAAAPQRHQKDSAEKEGEHAKRIRVAPKKKA